MASQSESSPPPPRAFRWIRVGEDYRYGPALGKGDDARRGCSCTVLVIGRGGQRAPVNCLVRFADGHEAVVPWGVLAQLRGRIG